MDLVTRAYSIPMRIPFRGLRVREGLLLRGPAGWGEFSPFPEYGPEIAHHWLAAAQEAAFQGWPAPLRDRIPVNTTIPAVDAETAHALAHGSGCSTAKIKVGDDKDLDRVAAVRDALGPQGKVRVDANGAWDVDAAVKKIRRLNRFSLEYVEQPVRTLNEMERLRRLIDVPLAVDESIRNGLDPTTDLREAADIVVLKVQPLGGVRSALALAESAGLPAVVSSALESSVGIAAGVALAAALPELPYACGLGTVTLMGGDVVTKSLIPSDGYLDVRPVEVADDLGGFETASENWVARMRAAQ
jgi:o-succinylbenzoate synthase